MKVLLVLVSYWIKILLKQIRCAIKYYLQYINLHFILDISYIFYIHFFIYKDQEKRFAVSSTQTGSKFDWYEILYEFICNEWDLVQRLLTLCKIFIIVLMKIVFIFVRVPMTNTI